MDLKRLRTKTAWIASLLIIGRLIGMLVFATWITNTAMNSNSNTSSQITDETK